MNYKIDILFGWFFSYVLQFYWITRKVSLFDTNIRSNFIFFVKAPQFWSLNHCSSKDFGTFLLLFSTLNSCYKPSHTFWIKFRQIMNCPVFLIAPSTKWVWPQWFLKFKKQRGHDRISGLSRVLDFSICKIVLESCHLNYLK